MDQKINANREEGAFIATLSPRTRLFYRVAKFGDLSA